MRTYHEFADAFQRLLDTGKQIEPALDRLPPREPGPGAPVALLFSPHPDDECITGLLPLRLASEGGWRIVNVPVTHGSDPQRQAERHEELVAACGCLFWECAQSPAPTETDAFPAYGLADLVSCLKTMQPAAVFFPHAKDWNSRHLWTHDLVLQALDDIGDSLECLLVETEFWGAMDDPNLMVEASAEQVGTLVSALSLHTGEVERNPYHLRLPAWMIDNVRRGAERIGGQGGLAPDFDFATLYRLSLWIGGKRSRVEAQTLPVSQSAADLFHQLSDSSGGSTWK